MDKLLLPDSSFILEANQTEVLIGLHLKSLVSHNGYGLENTIVLYSDIYLDSNIITENRNDEFYGIKNLIMHLNFVNNDEIAISTLRLNVQTYFYERMDY